MEGREKGREEKEGRKGGGGRRYKGQYSLLLEYRTHQISDVLITQLCGHKWSTTQSVLKENKRKGSTKLQECEEYNTEREGTGYTCTEEHRGLSHNIIHHNSVSTGSWTGYHGKCTT